MKKLKNQQEFEEWKNMYIGNDRINNYPESYPCYIEGGAFYNDIRKIIPKYYYVNDI